MVRGKIRKCMYDLVVSSSENGVDIVQREVTAGPQSGSIVLPHGLSGRCWRQNG